jgi:glucosamine-6-phosphate deaminase
LARSWPPELRDPKPRDVEVVILADADAVAALVADAVEGLLKATRDGVLGLATGTSPLRVYAELVARQRAGRMSFANARAFLLDEYIGLPAGHPQSYRTFIEESFTALVDFPSAGVFSPN